MRRHFPFGTFLLLFVAAALGIAGMAPTVSGQEPSPSPAALTDSEILHVFITANQGEILSSEPLLDDLENPEVNQFAQDMIAVHTQVIAQAEALELAPMDNPVSQSMTQMVTGKTEMLDRMDSPELDARYMETQVILHGHTLAMLDHVLLPNATDAQLRALLEQTRPEVEQHLRRAQALHHQLMPMANTGTDADGMN